MCAILRKTAKEKGKTAKEKGITTKEKGITAHQHTQLTHTLKKIQQ